MIFSEHFKCHSYGQVQYEQSTEYEERTAVAVGAFTKEGYEHRTGDTGEAPSCEYATVTGAECFGAE